MHGVATMSGTRVTTSNTQQEEVSWPYTAARTQNYPDLPRTHVGMHHLRNLATRTSTVIQPFLLEAAVAEEGEGGAIDE